MNQDYETRAYITWNLEEAQEELSRILESIRPSTELDEAVFRTQMTILFSHLNAAITQSAFRVHPAERRFIVK